MALPKLESPTFELRLPSNNALVRYRPFLVKEHKVLLTLSEANEYDIARVVKDLVKACTFNNLDIEKLPHFDIEYIFLNLRAKSIGENVDVVVNCECGNKVETSYNIDNVVIERPENHSNKIMLTDVYGVEMLYPKFEDVVDVFASNNAAKVLELILKSIAGIFDQENYWYAVEHPKEDLEEFVLSLTKEQFNKIERFFATSPKIVQKVEADCNVCGKHTTTRLEGLSNFFV